MKTLTRLMAGAVGLAAIAAAAPAAAQYYPNSPNNVIGQIIGSVLGYGQYPYGNYGYGQSNYMASQTAVNQCAQATEARLNGYAMNNAYNQWNPYRNPYSGWGVQGQARVLGIQKVTMKSMGRLRVMGVATSGRRYNQNWGYGGYSYNSQYGTPDLKFVCNADSGGRVYDVQISRYRGYNGYGYRGY